MHISNKTKQEFLTPPPSDAHALKSEFNKRRKEFQEKRIPVGELDEHLEQGWHLKKQDAKHAKVERRKPIDERLENRFWCSMYRLGYKELGSGRNFNILVSKPGEPPIYKQIDVFAKDDETVIVAECKSCETPKRRNLKEVAPSIRTDWRQK